MAGLLHPPKCCMSGSTASLLLMIICMSGCVPPENPIKCISKNLNCTITNSYGSFPDRSICYAAEVAYPRTEEEIVSLVATATVQKRKMKIATRFSHSIPKLVCPDDEGGLLISTKYLNKTINVDQVARTISVESGVTLRQLIEEAAKWGLALPYTPYWWGLTVGGLMGTGAHGSTLWGAGSAVHDHVVQLRIVTPAEPKDGYAEVRILDASAQSEELNAAMVSLGVLGVVSQVTLKLEPLFKRSITYLVKNDSNFKDEARSFGKQHEFGDLIWYPSQHRVVYRIDDRVSSNISGNALLDFPGFRPTSSFALTILRTQEERDESEADADGKCVRAKLTTSGLQLSGYGLTNNGIVFTGYPIVGYHNHLQASGSCLSSHEDAMITTCPWDNRIKGLFFHQTAFSISLSNVSSFIHDIQKLVELAPKSLCGVEMYNGILIRYVTKSRAFLGKQEDALDFDITYYRSKDPTTPRLYQDILEEIEQLAMFKYRGLPHWGKNRNVAFYGVINKYENAHKFLKVKEMYDPLGLFSSKWTDQILGLNDTVIIWKKGCALEGLCICSDDTHCAPNKGYLCRPGKIYTDARVCAKVVNQIT